MAKLPQPVVCSQITLHCSYVPFFFLKVNASGFPLSYPLLPHTGTTDAEGLGVTDELPFLLELVVEDLGTVADLVDCAFEVLGAIIEEPVGLGSSGMQDLSKKVKGLLLSAAKFWALLMSEHRCRWVANL